MNNNFAERGRQGESLLSSLARTGDVLARADRQYTSGPITCTPSLARRRLTHVHTCVRRRRGRGDAPAPPLTAQRTAPARHPHPDTNRRRAGTGLEERYWRGIRRAIAQPGGRNEWHTREKGRTHLFEGLGPLLRRHLLDGDRLVGRPAGRLRVGAARVARRGRARAGKDAARWEDASEHRRRVASLRRPPKRRVVKLTVNVDVTFPLKGPSLHWTLYQEARNGSDGQGPRGVARAVPPGGMFAHKCVGHGWPGLALENLAWHPDSLQHRGGPLREVGAAQARRRCAQSLRPVGPQRGL